MAAGQLGVQTGASGYAFARGIPAMTVQWAGRVSGPHTATVFNTVSKHVDCDTADSFGNLGEWRATRTRNKRMMVTIEAKPVATTQTLARAIAADAPTKADLVSITGATDTSINSSGATNYDYYTESVDVRYNPEGEAVISLTLKCYLNDDDSHITPATLTD